MENCSRGRNDFLRNSLLCGCCVFGVWLGLSLKETGDRLGRRGGANAVSTAVFALSGAGGVRVGVVGTGHAYSVGRLVRLLQTVRPTVGCCMWCWSGWKLGHS